ncbi:MAG: SDR family oxidoreductase, partial [Rhodospirillaceae bacterium]|nr:SDR family oxidoreductase [Rhodospirillaceae bacterium]
MTEQRKTVILTGASRGIGHATVQRFSDEGWRIITCSREDVPEHCKRDPNWSHHLPTDLSDSDSVAAFIGDANEILGDQPVHALVNNAAVSPKTPYQERLGCLNGDLDRWREVFELNLFTPLLLARGFAGALGRGAKDGDGAIVNITSIAGHAIHPFAGSAYSTSKAALSALTREMAVEFAALGVRVNAVAPGEIETEMVGEEYEPL